MLHPWDTRQLNLSEPVVSFHRFAQSFHPFYKKNPQVTENIHKQFIEDLQRTIQVGRHPLSTLHMREC